MKAEYIEEYPDYYQSCNTDDFEEITFDEETMWDNLWKYLELKTQSNIQVIETDDDNLFLLT